VSPDTPDRRALALDYGERRIGVAYANSTTDQAHALITLNAKGGRPEWYRLDKLVTEWQPAVIIIGLPYNMDGSRSSMTARAEVFGAIVGERYGLPVETVDERLTSEEAAMELREQRRTGVRNRRIRKTDIDSHAARLIAESWIRDVKNNNQKPL
jgi:putative Holliday junction resolvase